MNLKLLDLPYNASQPMEGQDAETKANFIYKS